MWMTNCPLLNEECKHAFNQYSHHPDHRGDGIVAGQSLHPNGVQHQDDPKRRRGGRRRGLGIAVHRTMGTDINLSAFALDARSMSEMLNDYPITAQHGSSDVIRSNDLARSALQVIE
jgi:hypothetical protein